MKDLAQLFDALAFGVLGALSAAAYGTRDKPRLRVFMICGAMVWPMVLALVWAVIFARCLLAVFLGIVQGIGEGCREYFSGA